LRGVRARRTATSRALARDSGAVARSPTSTPARRSPSRRRGLAPPLALALALASSIARAESTSATPDDSSSADPAAARSSASAAPAPGKPPKKASILETDYTTRRYEPAGVPLIGGSSDVGFQFGAVATLSHFADGTRPYAWNMDLVLTASVKSGPTGPEIAQESFLWSDDIPGLWGGKLRLNPQVSYQRTINTGYFGLGNASTGAVAANYSGPAGRYFEWLSSIARATLQPRLTLVGPWSLTGALGYRYADPTAYADSKLARDASTKNPDGSPVIRGLQALSLPELAVGAIYDSRDDEVFTRSGAFHQIAVSYTQAVPTSSDVRYGEAQLFLSAFRPIGPLVLAGRLVGDFELGNVPFYDLAQSGPLGQTSAVGGSAGVRGVPVGRYSGEIKIYGNAELRAMFFKFSVLRQRFTIGGDALFDTGRSWLDYTFRAPLDGNGLGLKYGAGGGLYVLWGQAAIFRIDVAYSPDAAAENPSFPVGFYVEDGTMF
jgi:hypothetical protein